MRRSIERGVDTQTVPLSGSASRGVTRLFLISRLHRFSGERFSFGSRPGSVLTYATRDERGRKGEAAVLMADRWCPSGQPCL